MCLLLWGPSLVALRGSHICKKITIIFWGSASDHWGSLQRSTRPVASGDGLAPPPPRTPLPISQPFGPRPYESYETPETGSHRGKILG